MRKFYLLYGLSIVFFIVLALFFAVYVGGRRVEYSSSVFSFSIFEEYEVEEKQAEPKSATILAVGDIMLDRYVREVTEKQGGEYIFSCKGLDTVLASADLVLANLEGPITSRPSVSVGTREKDGGSHFTFTFPTSSAELLARHNIRLMNVGNNHILNFGSEGLAETRRSLEDAGIDYFGDPSTTLEAGPTHAQFAVTVHNIPITFVSYNEFWHPDMSRLAALQAISQAEERGRVAIVYAHWGDEYVAPPSRVRTLAREFVDAGADIVIGSHPHVVQENEMYKEKMVYYSLGNFIFDQYFSEDVRNGLALKLAIPENREEKIAVEEIRVHLERDGRTCLIPAAKQQL